MRTPVIRYIDYAPRGKCKEIFRHRELELMLAGPAGTGKSRACLEKVNWVCEKYPNVRALMVRKTRRSLTQSAMVTFEQKVLPRKDSVPFHTEHQEYRYPNGSIMAVAGIDDPKKIYSSEWDFAYVQQAEELDLVEWESIRSRLRNNRMPYQQLLGDCNPDAPHHWIKTMATVGKLLMLESRHEDNPVLWDAELGEWTKIGREYIANLDALTGIRYQRLRLGLWAAAEGLVYEGYDPTVHLVNRFDIPADWPRAWVVDFGFMNPFVCQFWAHDHDGRLYRYREFYRTGRTVEEHCHQIRAFCKEHQEPVPVVIICDHDAEDRATFTQHMGLATMNAYKAIPPGVQAVQQRFKKAPDGKPRLFLLRDSLVERDQSLWDRKKPTCTEEEILSYCWPQGTAGKSGEAPVKVDDHAMDAMRYLVAHSDKIAFDPAEERRVHILNPAGSYQISKY